MAEAFLWPARIRFVDTDASQRIHYSAVFRHFEAAEEEFLRSIGYGYTTPERCDYGFPRVHVECDMSGALLFDDLVYIAVRVERVGRSSYTLGFQVLKNGEDVTRGRIVVACLDKSTQRARPLPEDFAAALRKHVVS